MQYRIVVCLDVEAASPKEAYGKIYTMLSGIKGLGWESSDEWYEENEELDLEKLSNVRLEYLTARNKQKEAENG